MRSASHSGGGGSLALCVPCKPSRTHHRRTTGCGALADCRRGTAAPRRREGASQLASMGDGARYGAGWMWRRRRQVGRALRMWATRWWLRSCLPRALARRGALRVFFARWVVFDLRGHRKQAAMLTVAVHGTVLLLVDAPCARSHVTGCIAMHKSASHWNSASSTVSRSWRERSSGGGCHSFFTWTFTIAQWSSGGKRSRVSGVSMQATGGFSNVSWARPTAAYFA